MGKGKCYALIDEPEASCMRGSVYRFMSEEQENALIEYEIIAYEVVRCLIEMNGIIVEGCTFRCVGETD